MLKLLQEQQDAQSQISYFSSSTSGGDKEVETLVSININNL